MIPQAPDTPSATSPGFALGSRSHLVSWALVLGIVALAATFAMSDMRAMWHAATDLDLRLLALPFVCGLLSFVAMSLSYQGIAQAAGADVPFWEMLKITFVANTANYLVTTGGLSGFAVRMYFFMRLQISSGTAVIISLVQTLVTNFVLLLFVVTGFVYLLKSHELHGFALGTTAVLLSVFVLGALVSVLLLIHRELRRRTLFFLAEAAHWITRRFLPRQNVGRMRIWRFQRNLNRGIEFLLARKRRMIMPTVWIVVDWFVTLFILYSAFVVVRYRIPMSFVIVGFAVGIVLSLVSFVPGGLGIMEGSMAAIFASLSVPFETAVVAVLIFRLAYYLLPLVISLFFFRGMLFQGTRGLPQQLEESP